MAKLTPMQRKVYEYLQERVKRDGYPPSVREICAEMGFKSPSTAHFHLKHLEKAGVIAMEPGKGRAIRLLEPSGATAGPRIPVLKTVAAGRPVLTPERIQGYLTLEPLVRGDFALRVGGDSMLNAGIRPGDYVIARQQSNAKPGELVVALIGDEATVKRYALKNGRVLLMPENDDYSPIEGFLAQILGVVTAVVRFCEPV